MSVKPHLRGPGPGRPAVDVRTERYATDMWGRWIDVKGCPVSPAVQYSNGGGSQETTMLQAIVARIERRAW